MKITNRYVAAAIFIAVFIGMWILVDYLFTTLITDSEFVFSAWKDLALPALVGAIVGFTIFVLKDKLRRG